MLESLNKLRERNVDRPTTYTAEAEKAPSPAAGTPPTDFFASIMQQPASRPLQGDIRDIPLTELHEFNGHIFTVEDGPDMDALVESLKTVGQLEPAIVRLRPAGGYELIAGHRRRRAHELAGLPTMKCLVVNMDDDTAEQAMMESNKHRPFIAPSVKAKIYEREMQLYERQQGRRTDLETTSATGLPKLRWRDEIGKNWGVSGETVRQYILLLNLAPALLEAVDQTAAAATGSTGAMSLQLPMKAGVALASIRLSSQLTLLRYMDGQRIMKITVPQAQTLEAVYEADGALSEESIAAVLGPAEKPVKPKLTSFSLPSEGLNAHAKQYRKDAALQSLIVETINRYIADMEARAQ